MRWYKLAAAQGDALAQLKLGACFQDGTGVEADEVEAVRWYKLAAAQGLAEAQNNLGLCYLRGEGAAFGEYESAVREAPPWARRAAAGAAEGAHACDKPTGARAP